MDTASGAVAVASGAALMGAGVSLIGLAGGVTALLGGPAVTALAFAIAWSGVGFLVLGAAVAIYVGYRMVTQMNGSPSAWTRPTDMPVQQWNQRFAPYCG